MISLKLNHQVVKAKDNQSILDIAKANGVEIPTDLSKAGWIILSNNQERDEAMYLFGNEFSIKNDELEILFTSFLDNNEVETSETDDSLIIVAIIVVAAIAASIFYLKGYKKKT